LYIFSQGQQKNAASDLYENNNGQRESICNKNSGIPVIRRGRPAEEAKRMSIEELAKGKNVILKKEYFVKQLP